MRLPNGYGSIISLGGNRRKKFAVRVTTGYKDNGTQTFKYLGYFESKKEAFEFLVNYNANPEEMETSKITFAQVYEEWSEKKFPKIRPATQANYTMTFNKCKKLYKKPFKDIRTKHLQDLVDENADLTMTAMFRYLFNQLYRYALKHDIVEKNYSQFIELPKRKDRKKKVPFTLEEIEMLWSRLDVPNTDILLILIYSGLRISELLELRIENINLAERWLFVEKSKTRAGIRKVPIHRKIAPLIENRIGKHPFLVLNTRGNPIKYNSFKNVQFVKLKEALGIDHTIHETRHTFVSQCDRLELNDVAVKRIIGHADSDITQGYTHKTIEELIEVIDLFDY
jgi:integrase